MRFTGQTRNYGQSIVLKWATAAAVGVGELHERYEWSAHVSQVPRCAETSTSC